MCKALVDSIDHMLVLCPGSDGIWKKVLTDFASAEEIQLTWTPEQLLFGFLEPVQASEVLTRLNTIVLLVKYYIYKERRLESATLSATAFAFELKRHVLNSWHVAQTNGRVEQFEEIWKRLL